MLDADLAEMYGVLTKNLNLAVRRNLRRFPPEFQLSPDEASALRLQIATSNIRRGGRRYAPYAFTEHGVAMLSSVLRSARANRRQHRDHPHVCQGPSHPGIEQRPCFSSGAA